MIKLNTDTLISYLLDPVCVIGEICTIHKYKHIEVINKYGKINKLETDLSNENFDQSKDYFISESGQVFFTEKEIIPKINIAKFEAEILYSDTMQLNDLQYLKQGDTRSASEFIRIYPHKENLIAKNDLNGVVYGVEFTLMLLCSVVYLVNSFNFWFAMFIKINFALKS